jgi:hypothetical protein
MASVKKYKNGMTHTEYMREYRADKLEKMLVVHAKARSRSRGHEFNIQESDIDVPIICPILGIPIFVEGKINVRAGPSDNSPSLDRIDNTKGYIKGNVQVISHKANTMKGSASPEDLIKFARWIIGTYHELL